MKTQNGFTLLENEKDVKNWLNKQKVTTVLGKRQIKKYLQNHILAELNH